MGEIAGGVYLDGMALENLANEPDNFPGRVFYNTTRKQVGVGDGTVWVYGTTSTHGLVAQSAGAVNVTVDASTGNTQRVNLTANQGGNTTTITNPKTGQRLTLQFVQDGTGSRTYAWPTNVRFAANTAPAASTGANRMDSVDFVFDGSLWEEVGRAINVPTT